MIVRRDLPLGMLAAQIVHAAGESVKEPVSSGTYAVVLATKDEQDLLALESQLQAKGVSFTAIRENGDQYKGELMAIGVEPKRRSMLRRHFSSLPLLK